VLNIAPRLPLKLRGAKCLDLQGANLFTIEIQQMPFQGEVEMSCLDANREIGTFVREVRK
ncbi:hypothetical protein, partial [Aeromonas caviae]|uniref:hypothetical protein n=1 Tax=Aeromonas caviae TaxID=648 RepID=UPI002B49182D